MNRLVTLCGLFVMTTLSLSACGIDFEARQQAPGQECRADQDCAPDLVCRQRRCTPLSRLDADLPDAGLPDSGPGDTGLPDSGPGDTEVPDPDTDLPPDGCQPGAQTCADEQTALRCEPRADGTGAWTSIPCAAHEFCAGETGECLPREEAPCCPDGCGPDQVCHQCQCVEVDPASCTYQDQPCEEEGQVSNGFICTNLDGEAQLTCLGICTTDRSNPSSSCPTPGTYCYAEPFEPNGVCLSSCERGDRCAAEHLSCVAYEHDGGYGLCLPTSGQEPVGAECDDDEPFSCTEGAICIDEVCRASCRPFGGHNDCGGEDVCLPVGAQTGVCMNPGPNAGSSPDTGGVCNPDFPTCGADATFCAELDFSDAAGQCLQLCRLQADDCAEGSPCIPAGDDESGLGICLSFGGF
ncbi:hypothetical protein DL240_10340 [Lujinxingia litoralis]|uniref:Uncharacterized protein n=1 Tax=Lujinxingia litoralis TaxID=2211119 RepID=A0A328C9D4_9DELT|nr:hypothetical protein [Lujinxingia litoralis]RAL22243.1 hypothetical protein DL240_10340 [Lujinxingia litoralis]